MSHSIIFLDKDGTLLKDIPFNVDPKKMVFAKGAKEGVRNLALAGFAFIVVTNQKGVALGKFKEEDLTIVHSRLKEMMEEIGARLLNFYYCPHLPEGKIPMYSKICHCRKPAPGLLCQAMTDFDTDLANSWMIGDILDDVEAGNRVGLNTILLNSGHETLWEKGEFRVPDFVVPDLKQAADHILLRNKREAYAKSLE
jgi:D-glycero-D-manno-heptose 1,7-bisphosphate phosphatase